MLGNCVYAAFLLMPIHNSDSDSDTDEQEDKEAAAAESEIGELSRLAFF